MSYAFLQKKNQSRTRAELISRIDEWCQGDDCDLNFSQSFFTLCEVEILGSWNVQWFADQRCWFSSSQTMNLLEGISFSWIFLDPMILKTNHCSATCYDSGWWNHHFFFLYTLWLWHSQFAMVCRWSICGALPFLKNGWIFHGELWMS